MAASILQFAIATQLLAATSWMKVSDVRKGQTGHCLTVFEDETIEAMDFEVRGTMANYLGPGHDLIVIRLLGDKTHFSGVVAGMSGSPCYIDDTLFGALGYAFASFSKEPIAGVMPIQSMLEVLDFPHATPWAKAQVSTTKPRPPTHAFAGLSQALGIRTDAQEAVSGHHVAGRVHDGGTENRLGGARPIATPLHVAGVSDDALKEHLPWLHSHGFEVVRGGRAKGTQPKGDTQRLRPGDAVAVVLATGDIDIAATGTVTYVDKNRFLAFGHPFANLGDVSFPIAKADIVHTLASYQRSFKMSVTRALIGELFQDRLSAIAGRIGTVPPMIPVQVRLKHQGHDKQFSFSVVRDPAWTPRLLMMGLGSVAQGLNENTSRGTLSLRARIDVDDLEPLIFETEAASESNGHLFAEGVSELGYLAGLLWSMPLGTAPKISIEVDLEYDRRVRWSNVESIRTKQRVQAGQQTTLYVTLRDHHGVPSVRKIPFTIPKEWVGQHKRIVVTGAPGADYIDNLGKRPWPRTRADVLAYFSNLHAPGHLYALAVAEGTGFELDARSYQGLPGSATARWSGTRAMPWSGPYIEEQSSVASDKVVAGFAMVDFFVDGARGR